MQRLKLLITDALHKLENLVNEDKLADNIIEIDSFVLKNLEQHRDYSYKEIDLIRKIAETIKKYIPSLVIKQDDFKEDFDKRNYIVSNEKLEALGWKPIYDLDYGIKQLISAYKIVINKNNQNFTNL